MLSYMIGNFLIVDSDSFKAPNLKSLYLSPDPFLYAYFYVWFVMFSKGDKTRFIFMLNVIFVTMFFVSNVQTSAQKHSILNLAHRQKRKRV